MVAQCNINSRIVNLCNLDYRQSPSMLAVVHQSRSRNTSHFVRFSGTHQPLSRNINTACTSQPPTVNKPNKTLLSDSTSQDTIIQHPRRSQTHLAPESRQSKQNRSHQTDRESCKPRRKKEGERKDRNKNRGLYLGQVNPIVENENLPSLKKMIHCSYFRFSLDRSVCCSLAVSCGQHRCDER